MLQTIAGIATNSLNKSQLGLSCILLSVHRPGILPSMRSPPPGRSILVDFQAGGVSGFRGRGSRIQGSRVEDPGIEDPVLYPRNIETGKGF